MRINHTYTLWCYKKPLKISLCRPYKKVETWHQLRSRCDKIDHFQSPMCNIWNLLGNLHIALSTSIFLLLLTILGEMFYCLMIEQEGNFFFITNICWEMKGNGWVSSKLKLFSTFQSCSLIQNFQRHETILMIKFQRNFIIPNSNRKR